MHAGVEKTPVIHTHVVEGLDSTNNQNAPTRVYLYTHTRVHIHVYACIYTDTYIYKHTFAHAHIHAYMHTHPHIQVHAHLYTDKKSDQQRLNSSNNIIDAHTHPYTYACIYTCICIDTYVHNLQ